jgi:hypothetical protein
MSIEKIVVTHKSQPEFGTGIIVNETIKDSLTIDDEGNQGIQEVARISVVWEHVPSPAINYHSSDELVFKGFYDEINSDEYPIEMITDYIDTIVDGDEASVNVGQLKHALLVEFGSIDDNDDDDDDLDDVQPEA